MTILNEKNKIDTDLLTLVDVIEQDQADYYAKNGTYKQIKDILVEYPEAPIGLKDVCQVHVYNNPNPEMGHGYVIHMSKELPEYSKRISKGLGTGPEPRAHDWKEEPLL